MALLAAPAVEASSDRKLELRDLVCRADAIVHGVVTEQARENDFEFSTIVPTRVFKPAGGESPVAFVERSSAHLHGGHPRYRPGQEVVVFLEAIPDSPRYRTIGLSQGKFEVVDGRVARVNLSVAEFAARIVAQDCAAE